MAPGVCRRSSTGAGSGVVFETFAISATSLSRPRDRRGSEPLRTPLSVDHGNFGQFAAVASQRACSSRGRSWLQLRKACPSDRSHDGPETCGSPVIILNLFSLAERPQQFRTTVSNGPLRLYWFSQTIGLGRGLEDVIRAMGKLRECEIELHLRGVARPDHWENLRDLAASNGVRSEAIVLHAPAPSSEMIRAAVEFDVGLALEQSVSLNRDLCLTNKIFSYLLAGNAIAATSTTGQRPIVEVIGRAGFLYEPGDVDALAHGLRTWSQDRQRLQHARWEAWTWGTRQFNWDVEKKKLVDVVSDVLTNRECANSVC